MISKIAVVAVITASIVIAVGTGLYYSQTMIAPLPDLGEKGTTNNASSSIVISSPYAREFKLPDDTWPNGIVVDSRGTVWTVGSKSHSLFSLDSTGRLDSYPLPNDTGSFTMVWTMTEGKDGSIWFSGSGPHPMWRFDPQTEKFESVNSLSAPPIQMKVDESGNIWYTILSKGKIGAVQKVGQTYNVKELELGKESFPSGLFVEKQNLWITRSVDGKIALFHVTYGGNETSVLDVTKVTEFPRQDTLFSPTDIIINNDSAWVTEHGTSFLTEYDIDTSEVKRYPTAIHPIQISTLPYWLAQEVNGKGVWFNEHRGNRIAFFDFANRTLTEYEVPTRNPQMGYIANALTVTADPTDENKAWFTELTEDKIGYIDRSKPIPFNIHSSGKQIVIEKGQTASVNIEITRNPGVELFNNTLSFGVSSSSILSGVLLNATADFSPNLVDLTKVSESQTITLELKDEGIQKGQHVLAVSATDGAVIRTIFLDLVIR